MLANDSWVENWLRSWQQQRWGWGALCSWVSTNIRSSLPQTHFQATTAGPFPPPLAAHWLTPDSQWRFTCSTRASRGTTRTLGMSFSYMEWLKDMSLLVRAWQNVVHWRREWQKPLHYSCFDNPVNSMKRPKDMMLKDEHTRLVALQYTIGEEWRNNYRKNVRSWAKAETMPSCGCV